MIVDPTDPEYNKNITERIISHASFIFGYPKEVVQCFEEQYPGLLGGVTTTDLGGETEKYHGIARGLRMLDRRCKVDKIINIIERK